MIVMKNYVEFRDQIIYAIQYCQEKLKYLENENLIEDWQYAYWKGKWQAYTDIQLKLIDCNITVIKDDT